MRLPKSLYTGYRLLKKSRAVVSKQNDKEAITYFQNILNAAQPKEEDFELYKIVKSMFNENKYKFLKFITDTKFECWVLWTDSRSIINYFKLRGVLYIKWLGKDDLYSVSEFVSNKNVNVVPRLKNSLYSNKYHITQSSVLPTEQKEQKEATESTEKKEKKEATEATEATEKKEKIKSWGDSPEST